MPFESWVLLIRLSLEQKQVGGWSEQFWNSAKLWIRLLHNNDTLSESCSCGVWRIAEMWYSKFHYSVISQWKINVKLAKNSSSHSALPFPSNFPLRFCFILFSSTFNNVGVPYLWWSCALSIQTVVSVRSLREVLLKQTNQTLHKLNI